MTVSAPQWYKDAIIYQLHVRSFCDSTGDGIGDFGGLMQKLGYLQDLGVTTIWLLPFYPSPLKDDGYDIADYTKIHPSYGSKQQFQQFLKEAHRHQLRVITELVLNHTSDQHPWFQRARRSPPGSRHRDYYVWSDTPSKYKSARIIFQDFEMSNWSWDAVAKSHYWHRFYHHQPDLNFDNPDVRKGMLQNVDHWLAMGVDGLRLDAVPYLFERENTSCENLPETHQFLKELRAHVDSRFPNRMLLAEANQWPEDAAAYFGNGDECHTAFHFPVMPRLFMAVQMEDRFPILDILEQTPQIPDSSQWVVFLRNHDELTLEMVTDEERDYMYRAYARDPRARINLGIRRRLAPLVGNDRRKIELLHGLLMSLIGTPVIYYGDEIGMGDNIYLGDRNGVRTPMQWSPDRNAGFSAGNPQGLFLPAIIDHEYHYETVNVETQERNPHSLLWWMRRLIALRKEFLAFGRGTLEFLRPENPKILAFVRKWQDQAILVVANLSRSPQPVQLDLSAFHGHTPLELFGRTPFPRIGSLPYLLTLTPYAFFWFELRATADAPVSAGPQQKRHGEYDPPVVRVAKLATAEFPRERRTALAAALPPFLESRFWFRGGGRKVQSAKFADVIPLPTPDSEPLWLSLVQVDFSEGDPELYVVPLGLANPERAKHLASERAGHVIAWLQPHGVEERGALIEASSEASFAAAVLRLFGTRRRVNGTPLIGHSRPILRQLRGGPEDSLTPSLTSSDSTRSTIVYGEKLVFKLFRRIERGPHPEAEAAVALAKLDAALSIPPLAGILEYAPQQDSRYMLGILSGFVRHQGDGWQLAVQAVRQFVDRVLSTTPQTPPTEAELPSVIPLALCEQPVPPRIDELLVPFDDSMELLGRRTVEVHRASASLLDDPAFSPIPFTPTYQRSLYQGLRAAARETMRMLRHGRSELSGEAAEWAEALLHREGEVMERYAVLLHHKIEANTIRIIGDYHLARVLSTGKDFVLFNLAGDEDRPISQRRIKRSPLRDVAGMLRSIALAAHVPRLEDAGAGSVATQSRSPAIEGWLRAWSAWNSAAFLRGYLAGAKDSVLVPAHGPSLRQLLFILELESALAQLRHQLRTSSSWTHAVLGEVLGLLDRRGE